MRGEVDLVSECKESLELGISLSFLEEKDYKVF